MLTHFSPWCLQVSVESCTWAGVFTSCGLALLFVWALLHLLLDHRRLRFWSFQLTQRISSVPLMVWWALLTPLLWFSYSIQHVVFITCCHELSEAAVTNVAFLYVGRPRWRHTPNRHYCHVLSRLESICFVGIIQRQGASFAKLMWYKIPNCVPYETRLRKQRKFWSVIDSQTCRTTAEQHSPFLYCKWTERPHSMKQSMLITDHTMAAHCISCTPSLLPEVKHALSVSGSKNNNVLCCWPSQDQTWSRILWNDRAWNKCK